MTTRAPAVLKMKLFVFLTNLEPQGFAFPFQIQSTLHHPHKKNKFVILVIDDHVLRKRGSRVYVVVVTVTLPFGNLPRLNEKSTSSTASLAM